jgi:hypothetical protein
MRVRFTFPVMLLLMAAMPASASEYLVRVDVADDKYAELAAGADVLALEPGFALVRTDEGELGALVRQFACRVLDQDPEGKLYFLIEAVPSSAILDIIRLGDVLLCEEGVLLLRTTEDRVLALNRLPVELCRLSREPMRIEQKGGELPMPAVRSISDSLIGEIVARVSADSVLGTIRRLQDFHTRYATHDSCRAAVDYARARLQAYGCDSTYLQTWNAAYAPNAVGIRTGRLNPRQIYVIGAHIDNTSELAPDFCPGADDNASGVATVLEAGRVLAGYDFDYTLQFAIFTGEEQGLLGSDSFVHRAYVRGDSIQGAMTFDMVSYGLENRDSMVIWKRTANPNCTLLANLYCANADTYSTLRYKVYTLSSGGQTSDHYSFWKYGYRCMRDKESDVTPTYHTIGDTIGPRHYVACGTNDVPLTVEAIKALVATFAKLAGIRYVSDVAEEVTHPARSTTPEASPNPFRGETKIGLTDNRGEEVRVGIFDAAGNQIRRLCGPGEVVWRGDDEQGRGVGPGVYFCRSEGSPVAGFRKVILTGR